ncbi:hypothetical protein AVEN_126644-1 [Araneus ventricosus]|uniref:Uncharacterized protein n=1 Tax=Araneus ventricosus TaxID=182803 RepID=A0A4Y2K6F4_ARAVE|nr:hypothetical protein AVEN_126644-1 [Araneus ventricosus]
MVFVLEQHLEYFGTRTSDDEDYTWDGASSPNFRATPAGGRLAHDVSFSMHKAHIQGRSSVESVSNLESSALLPTPYL